MQNDFAVVTRRDMLGEKCRACDDGTLTSVWGVTFFTETVMCDRCLMLVDRWLTKREILLLGMGGAAVTEDA